MKKILALALVGLAFIIVPTANATRDCKSGKRLTAADHLANLDPDIDQSILDYDFFPGGSVTSGYKYSVEPAFTKGLYTRKDSWEISIKATPGNSINLAEGFDLSFSGGLKHKTEATFIRFFDDPCKAMFSVPYAPNRIPLKVRKAIGNQFRKGDYFVFRASLGFVLSGELLQLLGSSWAVSLGANYLVEGNYQLIVMRYDETHVRLKIIAHRGRDAVASVGVGYLGEFDVFKVDVIDEEIKRNVGTSPIKLSAGINDAKVMMVDYLLDLSDAEVGRAYEALLRKVKNFKSLTLAAPFRNDKDVEANIVLDLSQLEEIYRQDYRNNNVGRLKRNLRGTSKQKSRSFSIKLGNRILGYQWNGSVGTAKIGIREDNDNLEHYLLRSWDKDSSAKIFYSWFRLSNERGTHALFSTDQDYNITKVINFVHHNNRKRTRISRSGFDKVKLIIKKSVPSKVEALIPWGQWHQGPEDKFTNFGMRLQMVLTPEVVLEAPELSRQEIITLYRDHIKSKGLTPEDFFPSELNSSTDEWSSPEAQFEASLRWLAKVLEKVLNRKLEMLDRLNALTRLRTNKIFEETGFSFILALRPDKLSTLFHMDLNLSSNESLLDFEYGDGTISALYKKLLTIKAALDDDGFDLLREAESLSFPTQTGIMEMSLH